MDLIDEQSFQRFLLYFWKTIITIYWLLHFKVQPLWNSKSVNLVFVELNLKD